MIDLFGVSLQSTILFVLAGILIGHLLWYHDRSSDDEKLNGLENRYAKARGSVRKRKQEFATLQRDAEVQNSDLEQIREQQAALLKQKSDIEEEYRNVSKEAERLRGEKQELTAALTAEQSRSETVIGQLQEVLRTKSESEEQVLTHSDSVAQLQSSHQQLESQLEQNAETISSLNQSKVDLESQVVQLNQALKAQLAETAAVHVQEQTIAELEQQIEQLKESYNQNIELLSQTQQDLVGRCEDLDSLRAECEAANVHRVELAEQLAVANTELSVAKSAATQNEDLAKDLELAASSLAEQRELLQIRESELIQCKEQLVSVQKQVDESQAESKAHL